MKPNNKLVWSETVRIMLDLFDNVWGNKDEVVLDHTADVTLQVRDFSSLLVPLFD